MQPRIICSWRFTMMVGCDVAKNYMFLEIYNDGGM